MTHIERIEALLAGKKLDSTAINLWKHFPPYDEKPTTDPVSYTHLDVYKRQGRW